MCIHSCSPYAPAQQPVPDCTLSLSKPLIFIQDLTAAAAVWNDTGREQRLPPMVWELLSEEAEEVKSASNQISIPSASGSS
jgi:hypothetical protein